MTITVSQLLHALDHDIITWDYNVESGRFYLHGLHPFNRGNLEIEPLNNRPPARPRKKLKRKKTTRKGKVEVAVSTPAQARYLLFLGGLRVRVKEEVIPVLNSVGDRAAKVIVKRAREEAQRVLREIYRGQDVELPPTLQEPTQAAGTNR